MAHEEQKGQAEAQEEHDSGVSLTNVPSQDKIKHTHDDQYLMAEPGTSVNNMNSGEFPVWANQPGSDSAVHESMLKLLNEAVPEQAE